MPTVALCMIVKDVEKTILPCLKSIAPFVDEVIIVDTGSQDNTKDVIAKAEPRARILDFTPATHPNSFFLDSEENNPAWKELRLGPFSGKHFLADFGGARQFGWEQAKSDYLIWVDSDDIVEGGDQIKKLVSDMEAARVDTAYLRYDYAKDHKGNITCQLWRERVIRRGVGSKWVSRIHEVCIPNGVITRYETPVIVHKRGEYGIEPPVQHRNLKVLINWVASFNESNVDPRVLFYLASEERFAWPDKALIDLKKYVGISGSPDERATAHVYAGEIHEIAGRLDDALAEYAQATLANPQNPDGFFGAARIGYFKAKKGQVAWFEVIDKTERGIAIKDTVSVMANNPHDRARKYFVYYSFALIMTHQYNKALKVCDDGLKLFEPNDEQHDWLTKNRQVCLEALKPDGGPDKLRLHFKKDEPLEDPAADVPYEALLTFAIQLWKRGRDSDPARARRLLESLPVDIAANPKIKEALNYTSNKPVPEPSTEGSRDIVIWTGPAWEKWSPRNIETGIGGSELAAIYMARELVKSGHKVRVYNDCGDQAGTYDGVQYIHYDKSHPFECDVLIVSRAAPALADFGGNAKFKILWVHDIHCGNSEAVANGLAHADRIFCLSEWHKKYFCSTYPTINPDTVVVTRNGLDLTRFAAEPQKIGNRLIYSSSPDRGLDRLLDLFPRIREHVTDAELHVYYGFKFWESLNSTDGTARIEHYKHRMAETEGVIFHDRVGQKELAEAFLAAKVFSYPTWFSETSCMGCMEAQAAGCVPVTTAEAALTETVKHGVLIPPPENDARYAEAFITNVIRLLRENNEHKKVADAGRSHALTNLSWKGVATDWEKLFNSNLPKATQFAKKQPAQKQNAKPLRIAVILGMSGATVHGILDIRQAFSTGFWTGTVSGFVGIAWGLAERGHSVDAFCDAKENVVGSEWGGANFYPLAGNTIDSTYDAYISINEPDVLRPFPKDSLRVCVQWLNDFTYCQRGFDAYVDKYVSPSAIHRRQLMSVLPIYWPKSEIIPIGNNLEFFHPRPRRPGSIAFCSSPDRGLHHLLRIFPRVKERVPEANLRVYYRFQPWYDTIIDHPSMVGTPMRERAVEIKEAFDKYKDNGVTLVGPVPPKTMANELCETSVFAYTCDTVRFSEGYSISILDACAAGCVPIISNVDALPEVYAGAAHIIEGKPEDKYDEWTEAIVEGLSDSPTSNLYRAGARAHAQRHHRLEIARRWEEFLYRNQKR